MQAQTYYAATALRLSFPPLADSPTDVDVAVLGGAFAGLATARGLQERGIASVAVLEAQTIGHGASGRNGGFVFVATAATPLTWRATWAWQPRARSTPIAARPLR